MEYLNINVVEKLLLNNNFQRRDYSKYNPKSQDWCKKVREDFEISWCHSEIRTYIRDNEIINVQYQDDEVWSFIFGEVPLNFESNTISSTQVLNTYNGFETIDDVIQLCKFAKNIKLTFSCDKCIYYSSAKLCKTCIGGSNYDIEINL